MTAGVARKRQRILVLGLHLIALGLLALQAYVRRFPPTATAIPEPDTPEALWWGLWPITYLPAWAFALGAIAIIVGIAYAWWRELTPRAPAGTHGRQRHSTPASRTCWPLCPPCSWSPSSPFRSCIPAGAMPTSCPSPLPGPTPPFASLAPGKPLWMSSCTAASGTRFEPHAAWEDATPVYRILSPIAGAIYLAVLLLLSRNRRFAPGWLSYGLLVTLGLLQLFFGYIENYSFAAAAVLLYMYLGIRFVQARDFAGSVANHSPMLWPAATVLAFANAFHPSTLVLLPSLLYLAGLNLHRSRESGNKPLARDVILTGAQIAAPMALVFGFTWIMMETGNHGLTALFTDDKPGGGDARWFVPLRETATEWERYTMFSWPHLRDFANEQLLIAPVVLPSLVFLGAARLFNTHSEQTTRRSTPSAAAHNQPESRLASFLAIAFAFYLLLTWTWNPDYGGQRDWDLFSLVAIPEALLLVFMLARTLAPGRYLAMAAAPLIAVQALLTTAWIYQNTLPWSWP